MRRTLIFMILTATSLACSDDDLTGVATLQQQLEAARERWEARGMTNYEYEITYVCFCGFADRPALIQVRSGQVESALFIGSQEPVPQGLEAHFTTIDGLFDLLASYVAMDPDQASLTFNPDLGMPTAASFDFLELAADDEISFEAKMIFTAE